MLQKIEITEIPPDTPGFYSNIFLVCKASEGWRPVIDLKQLNAHIYTPHFNIHTISSVLNTVERDCTFKIDLQDVYFHILIHPDSRKYPCFTFENKVCQFRVLPFGLNTAPQVHVFIHLGQTVAASLHRQGISVISFLDDWLLHHPDRQALLRHQSQLLNTLDLVGLKLNEAKSELEPVQDIQFLGLQLCLDQGRASLPVSKAWKIIPCMCRISSQTVLLLHMRPLQIHFHSLGLTNWFTPHHHVDQTL